MRPENVTLYSTGCPKCKVLKQKLDGAGVQYAENNSVKEMLALGFAQSPVLLVSGKYLQFGQAIEWVNQTLEKEAAV